MADELAAADELPVDDLPRSPGGRIDRAAAREAFEPARERAEAQPDDWRSWYHLAFAYDAAGDRRRARESLRTASRLHRGLDRGGPAVLGDGPRRAVGHPARDELADHVVGTETG